MRKWFKNSKGVADEKQVCRYCGRSSNQTALKRTGEYGQYYSCIDSNSCLAYQNKDFAIYSTYPGREESIAEREARKKADHEARQERIRQELYKRNNDLIDKFLQIAERKVSIIDDYGDKNVEALPKEILMCL